MDKEAIITDVVYNKKAILDELRKAFGRCTYFVHRSHRVPLAQRMEFVKTMTYLSQVITSLEKDVDTKTMHNSQNTEINMRALLCLQNEGIIEIKDIARARAILGGEKEKSSQ